MELEDILLSEISQVQKDKNCMFPLICGRQIQKINVYTKQMRSYTHLYVEHTCNSGTTLALGGGGKGKENDRVNNIKMHYICAGRGHNDMY
jgi:hypothetical protein